MKRLILFLSMSFLLACASQPTSSTNTDVPASTVVRAHAPVNGLNLYYEIHGDGPPLVLIHGGGSTLDTTFAKVIPLLARKHKVIAIDEQAHGRTADISRVVSFANTADDVAALLTHLNIPKADIFGFSNGGTTALHFAIRHPAKTNRIVAASALVRHADAPAKFWKFMKTATFDSMPSVLKEEFRKVNSDPNALLVMFKRDLDRMNSFKDIPSDQLRALKAPVMVIVAQKDVISVESALRVSQQIPQAQLVVLPGGHGNYMGEISAGEPIAQGPEFTAATVSAFLLTK